MSRLQRADKKVYDHVTGLGPASLDAYTPKFVQATDNMAPWFLMSATLAATGGPRLRRTALRAILAAGTANLVSAGIKQISGRTRPDNSAVPAARSPYRSYPSTSFPSGHTAAAAAYAAGVMTDAPKPLAGLVALLAGGVAFSRVHSGVHYPGDVLAGVAIGCGAALLARTVVPPRPELVFGARTVADGETDVDREGSGVTVVVNPRSASGTMPGLSAADVTSRVARALPKARIIPLSAEDDVVGVMDQAARTSDVLAVAGGDGTVNAGAQAALDHDRPLLVLPDGTLNNFARTLGLSSVDIALRAFDDGRLARVDVGEVDGRIFLNTSSFGSYPRMVDRRDKWAERIGKWPAFALALWQDLREVSPTSAVVDGEPAKVWWAFVGNCQYRTHGRVPALREQLDDGRLDVRVLTARAPFPRLRAVADVLLGKFAHGEGYSERLTTGLTLTIPGEPRLLAVDGEVVEGSRTVVFTKRHAALRVFVPAVETNR
ncbi:bifunctional phosphatase PAP2/diacylglycerol kinase family protein [Nocardiopsis sp. HUAS JQ3]|uniref:bifunctional phosphatase PAP2/diacylglycerol kinase family protein n=1 Tax=Nocardiopsis sp. HUAS JQ3 TaxID=3061629 RepID=UPI0023A97755|nr:bifunctional phosphatase PAP2/diacylglycerol kinase family protein [Nocardiopsis sp. HUAS JQ3]WDZ92987.1 phosphatase PAP2 family protein [Nocardiopsis sp. HUAS JQ3]